MTDGKQRMIGIAALLYVAVLMVMVNGVKALLEAQKVRAGINPLCDNRLLLCVIPLPSWAALPIS